VGVHEVRQLADAGGRLALTVAACRLLDPLHGPRLRGLEIATIRLRLLSEPKKLPPDEAHWALELRALRVELVDALEGLRSCASCAVGYPPPHGHWRGGHCCGGATEHYFTEDEIACLRAGGTGPLDLRGPRGEQAGCAFRGPHGCSLAPQHRPNVCVRYACPTLCTELRASSQHDVVRRLSTRMQLKFAAYTSLRRQRVSAVRRQAEKDRAEAVRAQGPCVELAPGRSIVRLWTGRLASRLARALAGHRT
jgi:hypothetical protein